MSPVVPAPVLAQVWRNGARQASLVRLLALCEVEPMTEAQARQVGTLAAVAGTHDVVDLVLVESAARRGHAILTADVDDITAIVRAANLTVPIAPI
ncbi:MAG: twitching motility protein PilT [Candidatus Dormibacteria bacterium]